jgi:hypothetical protein
VSAAVFGFFQLSKKRDVTISRRFSITMASIRCESLCPKLCFSSTSLSLFPPLPIAEDSIPVNSLPEDRRASIVTKYFYTSVAGRRNITCFGIAVALGNAVAVKHLQADFSAYFVAIVAYREERMLYFEEDKPDSIRLWTILGRGHTFLIRQRAQRVRFWEG